MADLAAQVQNREVAAREVVAHSLAQIERLDGELNAFSAVDGERALADAAEIDERIARGEVVGPLAGVPLGVKDLEHAAGFVTTYGSGVHASDPPAERDSVLVSRLKAAGCVVVGKTNTPEHGYTAITENPTFGATRNPWSTDHSPGGSSGGSAAAIAAGMVPLATGSDGGGSIRIPSAVCGLSGIKLSQGRIALADTHAPGSGILGVRGPMARTIRDVALAVDASVGAHPLDVFSLPGGHDPWSPQLTEPEIPQRVAFSSDLGFATVDKEVATAVKAAVERLAAAGVEVVEIPPVFDRDPAGAWFRIWCVVRARSQSHLLGTPQWELIDPNLRDLIDYGLSVSGVALQEAMDQSHLLNQRMEEVAFSQAPLLLCPTLAGQAPLIGGQGTVDGVESQSWVSFTPFLNITRNPAGTVNVGFTTSGLPIGMQVIGRQREDLSVLQATAAIEDLMAIDRLAPLG